MPNCIIPNCRKFAPKSDPFCKEHRDPFQARSARGGEALEIIRNLLEHAVYDRERTYECAEAVDAAERFLGEAN